MKTAEKLFCAACVAAAIGGSALALNKTRGVYAQSSDCGTKGRWKNNPELWAHTPFTYSTRVLSSFDIRDFPGLKGATFIEVLDWSSGSGLEAKAKGSLAQAVPGILNAALFPPIGYSFTVTQVKSIEDAALRSGKEISLTQAGKTFDGANNATCPPTAVTAYDMTARREQNRVTVEWKTSFELNTAGYRVDCLGTDNQTTPFTVDLIPPKFDSFLGGNYTVSRENTPPPICQRVRILQIDNNGRVEEFLVPFEQETIPPEARFRAYLPFVAGGSK